MSSAPAVSVVVATRDREARLAALLAGLRAQTLPAERFEVIVVDDGSTDATGELLRAEAERGGLRLQALRHERSRGPAAARNRGWREATAAVIAFTDDDCVPTATWLETLLERVGDADTTIVKGRTAPNPAEAHQLGPYAKTVDIQRSSPHYETCNVAYPRALLERVGGFDEAYPSPAGEDSDLGWRAVAAGGEGVYEPEALVHHAVFERGPLGALRDALLATEGVQAYKRNPGLRAHLAHGVFYDRSHPLLIAAGVGVGLALGRRNPAALVLCAPYARHLARRRRATGAASRQLAYFVAFDALQTAATVRGALRNRVLVV
jgi:glycosyltransferase involved in cell wall biosynthesis